MMPIGFDFQCFGRKSEIHLCLNFLTSKVETPPQKDHLERLLADLLNERISQICLSFVKLVLLGIIWGWAGLASYWWNKLLLEWVEDTAKEHCIFFSEFWKHIFSPVGNLAGVPGNVFVGRYESWLLAQVDTIRSSSAGLHRPPLG